MKIKLAAKRGYCFGVDRAIELAEKTLAEQPRGSVYVLGPVIHNEQAIKRLADMGLKQVDSLEDIPTGCTVLIRSHGVEPEIIDRANQLDLHIVDASCRLVKRAQRVVRELHEQGYQVVMIGDHKHPEVRGVIGYAPDVIVIDSQDDLDHKLPKGGRLGLVAQTTHPPEYVARMVSAICVRPFREIKIVNTLCPEVGRRQQAALDLCKGVDVMFVLGGRKSANTRQLARLCSETGIPTFHLENWDQFLPEMIAGQTIAGLTAGASTPEWVVQEFAAGLEAIEPAQSTSP